MTTGCSVRLFVNLQMLLIEHDSIFYPVERQCQAQAAKTLVHFEIPVVVVTLKIGVAKKPSYDTKIRIKITALRASSHAVIVVIALLLRCGD